MYDFGAGAAVAIIVVVISAPTMRRHNAFLTALGAFLILLFTGGPVLLAFVGSVERVSEMGSKPVVVERGVTVAFVPTWIARRCSLQSASIVTG